MIQNIHAMILRIWIISCVSILLLACSNEVAIEYSDSRSDLKGTWKVTDATRKGKTTHLLDGMYFKFDNNKLEFNLPDTNLISYSYRHDSIFLENNEIGIIEVLSKGDAHLNIGFLYKQLYFQLSLQKETTTKK